MGYDLHITRKENWYDEDGPQITAEEWLQCIADDRELDLAGVNGDYFAYWRGLSSISVDWLDWFEGNIHTKNPEDALIDKMVQIAKKLNAKVQGDEGEIYLGGGSKNYICPDPPETPPRVESRP